MRYRGKKDIFAITTKKLENLQPDNQFVVQPESTVTKRFKKLKQTTNNFKEVNSIIKKDQRKP